MSDPNLNLASNAGMSQETINNGGSKSTGEASSSQNPLKKQIDPLELLNCLSILLNSKGAIKSIDEVQRVAGLMGKYSKKLVSKCIYLNILQATPEPLLDEFYKETGWNLVCAWLTEAMVTKNFPLAQQILSLLLVSPISIERLKRNNMPKMVKDLSKDCPHAGARETAENVVQRWKELVKGYTSEGPSALNKEITTTDPQSEASSSECVRVSVTNPVPLNIVNSQVSSIVVNNKSVIDEVEKSIPVAGGAENVSLSESTDNTLTDSTISKELSPIPKLKVGRGRGSPGRGGLRGAGRGGRARRKRGSNVGVGRGRGKSSISYADLLSQDMDVEKKDGPQDNSSSTEDASSSSPPPAASVPPLRITIRNGVKVLPPESKGPTKGKRKRISVDSTDSDDNKPLSAIRNECNKVTSNDGQVKVSEEEKDSKLEVIDGDTKEIPTVEKEEVEDDDEVVVKSRGRGKRRILVYNSDDDEDEEPHPKKISGEDTDKKKRKDDEKAKSKDVGDDKEKGKSKDIEKKKDRKNSVSEKTVGKTDKEKEEDKKKDRDKSRDKEKDRERERSKHKSSKDRDRDRDRDRNKDKDRKGEKSRDRDKDKDKDRDRRRDSNDKDKDKRKEQAEKDKATLDKVKPLSTEGLGKIPRKSASSSSSPKVASATPASFLDALGSADSDLLESKRSLLVKSKSRGFRNTGLLDETIKPPGVAGKRTTNEVTPLKRQGSVTTTSSSTSSTSSSSSSASTMELFDHKKSVKAPSSAPPAGDRPGGVKLISPKRPSLADDGGFMAALTAAGTDRKKIVRKRKSSDSEKSDGTQNKVQKGDSSKDSLDDSIKSEEEATTPIKINPEEEAVKKEEKMETNAILSPTSIKPTFNFYKDTLLESAGKEESSKEEKEEVVSNSGDERTATPDEMAEDDAADDLPLSSLAKKEDDKMEIEEPDDADTKEEPMEIASGDGEGDTDSSISIGRKEDSMEGDGVSDSTISQEAPVPAPAQEDYEKVEVTFTPTKDLKGVLVYHRSQQNKRKKGVKWKVEAELKEIFYFPMDETERVNVNTIKFNEMMMMEKAREKEFMFGKHRHRIIQENLGIMDTGMPNTCIDYGPYKLYPVHLPNPSTVTPGYKSMEKHVQAQREHNTMATFFHPAMLPETPTEPDPEMVQRAEPLIIPLKDVAGGDSVCDNRGISWPEPLFNPPEFPFMGNPAPHPGPPPPQSGGHWVLGNHTVTRFSGGPPMFAGPTGPGGNPTAFGPPPQGFPGGGGGWGGPDYGGPPVLLPNGPMGIPPGIGGSNHAMHGGPPLQGGPGMGMGGGPPPMGNRDNYHRFDRRGVGGDNVSWRGSQRGRGHCKHFRHGNCRHGDDCKFLHVPS